MNCIASARPQTLRRSRAFAAVCVAVLAAACGEPEPEEKFSLDSGGDPVLDSGGFRLVDADEPDTAARVPDVPDVPDIAVEPDAGADAGEPDDVPPAEDAPPPDPITSCAGVCGLFLEGNDCHCNHACVENGDCCEDFDVACGCESDGDCDDANDCTSDECVDGFCKQIPLPAGACCSKDADCPKGDACNAPKCITGSCTVEKKDCDDKLACTTDNCDSKTGDCVHKIQVGKCVIEDECKGGGDLKPDSDGCAACDPGKSQTDWSPKADKCLIDGACVANKGTPPGATCAVCTPAKSTSAWTLTAGSCFIDDKCYAKDAKNPANPTCEVCDPASSTTAWSGIAGKCAIDGACVAANATNPAASACSLCDPAKSKSDWTTKAGFCLIDGKCIGNGKGESAAPGCKVCDAAKSQADWTVKAAGATCDDGDACTKDTKCDATGECAGGTAIANCCQDDGDCTETPPKCEVAFCDKAKGTCGFKKDTTCCSSGVCCDIAAGKAQEKGFKCSTTKFNSEYQCDGQDVQIRDLFPGCNGTDAVKCSSSTPAAGDWKTTKTCAEGTTCTPSPPPSAPQCKTS